MMRWHSWLPRSVALKGALIGAAAVIVAAIISPLVQNWFRSGSPRQADLIAVFDRLEFVKRTEGQYLAVVYLIVRNSTDFVAENVRFQHQHRPGGWTGVVRWPERFTIPAGSRLPIRFSADTVGDPISVLLRGDPVYFALRADWDNPDLTLGCKMFFVEYFGAPGADGGQTILMPNIKKDLPERIKDGLSLPLCER